nr:hypothetical protein [Tanacetum cinerariifolium]
MRPVPPSPDRTPALYVYPLNFGNDSSDEDLSDTTKLLHTQSASTSVVHTSPTQSLPTSLVLVNQPKNGIPMPLGYKRSRLLSPSIPPSVPPPPPSVLPPEHIESLGDNIKASIWNLERRTGSMCVVPVKLPEVSPEHLPEISFGSLLVRHARLYFLLTSDVVKTLVADYAIPLDLHPCVPPSGLTMNRLPADKIGIYDQYLELSDVKDSSVADPSPTGVRAEDICRLCENIIDLRPVHPTMLYAIGLTTIWKHVGYHLVFKDGEGTGVRVGKGLALTANEVIPQHITLPLPSGSQIPEKSDHQKVGEYENERVLAAKRKARAAKDWADGKRAATEGASQRPKKKKTSHLSFALSDSEADGSPRSGFGTHHYVSLLNTIIPNEAKLTTEGDGLILESVNRAKEDADRHLDHVEDTTETIPRLGQRAHEGPRLPVGSYLQPRMFVIDKNFLFIPILLTSSTQTLSHPPPTTTLSQLPPPSHPSAANIQAAGNPHPAADHHHPSYRLHHLSRHKR